MRFLGFMFDTESKFGRALGFIGDVVVCNLLFLLFSLPIFTIGASFTAMCHVMLKSYRAGNDSVVSEFRKAFISNFKQSTLVYFLIVMIALGIYCAAALTFGSAVYGYVQAMSFFIYMVLFTFAMFIFPTIAAFNGSIKELIKDALFFTAHRPYITLMVWGVSFVPLTLVVLDKVNQPLYVFCFFFFGFALINKLNMWLMLKVFQGYLPNNYR